MGYDMYAVKQNPNTKRYEDPNYFRLNIWGMGYACQIMANLDMLNDDVSHDRFPDAPNDDWPDREGGDTVSPEWAAYFEKEDALLASHPNRDDPRVPGFKFGSNDGWHVTEIECRALVSMAGDGRAEGKDLPEWWAEWIGFIDHCSTHGGFKVH